MMRLTTIASAAILALSTAGLAQVVTPTEQKVPTGNTAQSGNDMAVSDAADSDTAGSDRAAGGSVSGNSDAQSDAPASAAPANTAGDPIDASGAPRK